MLSRDPLFASCLVVALTGAFAAGYAPAPEPVKAGVVAAFQQFPGEKWRFGFSLPLNSWTTRPVFS